MPQWTVDAPTRLAFDDVTALRVRAIAGSVAVLATSEAPALDITSISGQPLHRQPRRRGPDHQLRGPDLGRPAGMAPAPGCTRPS